MAISVREIVAETGLTRAGVYKAINQRRLTEIRQLGKIGVKEDAKLESFLTKHIAKKKRRDGKRELLLRPLRSNGNTK